MRTAKGTKRVRKKTKKARRVGAYSGRYGGVLFDWRTNEGKAYRAAVEALTEQVGDPTPAEQMVIQSTALLMVKCSLLAGDILRRDVGEASTTTYLAWQNAMVRNLSALGLKRVPHKTLPSPSELLEAKIRD